MTWQSKFHPSDNHLIICNSTFSKKNHPAKFLHKLLAKLQALFFKIFVTFCWYTISKSLFYQATKCYVPWILKMSLAINYISRELEIIDRTQDESCARISGTTKINLSVKKKTTDFSLKCHVWFYNTKSSNSTDRTKSGWSNIHCSVKLIRLLLLVTQKWASHVIFVWFHA